MGFALIITSYPASSPVLFCNGPIPCEGIAGRSQKTILGISLGEAEIIGCSAYSEKHRPILMRPEPPADVAGRTPPAGRPPHAS